MCIYPYFMQKNEFCICYSIRTSSTKITKIYDKALLESGLKITQYAIMKCIFILKNSNLNELSCSMGYNRSTLGRNIKILERKKLINLKKGNDKREIKIIITKNGVQVLKLANKCWDKINKKLTKKLGVNKKKMLAEIMDDEFFNIKELK